YAEAVVLVVRWASTRREAVKLVCRQLQNSGANMAGTLLNIVDSQKHAQYTYGDSGAYAGELEKYYVG
ncbi:MAG: hypothetical protein ACR2P6_09780, partial [Gammaproteobacteria bacterium]